MTIKEGDWMVKISGMMLLMIGVSISASAYSVPEIDPGMGGSAIALLSGALIMIRGRRKR
jgi:hypothetical protein